MRDALPIIHRLVEMNLVVLDHELADLDPRNLQALMALATPHTAWLFQALQHLGSTAAFTCVVWPHCSIDVSKPDARPFDSSAIYVPLVPHGHKIHTQFTIKFAHALKALLPTVNFAESDLHLRRAWLARWLAAAALSAHLALLPRPPAGQVFLDTIPGEDEFSAHTSVTSLINEFPPELIQALPVYGAAEGSAFEMCMNEIRMALATLRQEASQSRIKFELSGRLANLLAFCCSARGLDGPKQKGRRRKLHERACAFLVRYGVCRDEAQARDQLLSIGIGDAFLDRSEDDRTGDLRLPSKNSEDAARCRGKAVYLEHFANACAQKGILTKGLIGRLTRSPKLVHRLTAGIPSPVDAEQCEAAREIPEDADSKATGPGTSVNQDPELS